MIELKSFLSTSSGIISFIFGFFAAYAVVKELNFSILFKKEKSFGGWIAKIIIFIIICSAVWVILSSFFILIGIQE
ncbi:MAG TPA: ABC transporter permease [Dictyoglomaceae bacterium]|nr:ABC transporter permease [Dictyoglomaceae bacterium]HOL38842.1 ABC transporter permease [Dictyoglomaceae bacterium]HOP95369.1 ABC transporter permease [Dictyoglomaceae bacterium]HPP15741.1 ABC transporter permease [Dictyoglomaceae bacterium]HPU44240.1 ABC transporter permease [Dictyoglomaceae bacterium]